MDQNVDLLAKMPKIVVFKASPTGIFENRKFFRKNFSLGIKIIIYKGTKLVPKRDLLLSSSTWNNTFLIQGPPKSPTFEKKSQIDLLDNEVDTLSFILRPKFYGWGINGAPYGT